MQKHTQNNLASLSKVKQINERYQNYLEFCNLLESIGYNEVTNTL